MLCGLNDAVERNARPLGGLPHLVFGPLEKEQNDLVGGHQEGARVAQRLPGWRDLGNNRSYPILLGTDVLFRHAGPETFRRIAGVGLTHDQDARECPRPRNRVIPYVSVARSRSAIARPSSARVRMPSLP